jgi:hypothetical protein
MSEPDAVPLPREGEVFFDVRGEARSMRLSWYADSKVAVFSIWQGNRCTGTFRLPFADLERMIQTLQAGPHSQAEASPSQVRTGSYQGQGYSGSGVGYTGDYGPGPAYGPSPDYRQGPDYRPGRDYAQPAYSQPAAYGGGYGQSDYGTGPGTGQRGYGGDPAYTAERGYGAGYDPGRPYSAGRHGSVSQPYDEPYGSEPYEPASPYSGGQPYGSSEPYQPAQQYGAPEPGGYGPPGYDAPNYGDLGASSDRLPRPGRTAAGDPESVPDTAMMSFPSVPARNGPSSYR